MILLFYPIQFLFLAHLSYQDWRTKRISVLGLLGLMGITLPGLILLDFPINYEMVLGILGLLVMTKFIAFLSFGKSVMGNGDLVLLLPLLLSIHLQELPLFLISAGILGIIISGILR